MGEESWRVHTVGFPAIDLISEGNYATSNEIEDQFNLNTTKPIVLFTQHSVTTEFDKAAQQIKPSLDALRELAEKGTYEIIITYPNNDAGGKKIISEINKNPHKDFKIFRSLGRYYYHGVLGLNLDQTKKVVCVGNSSSGIKETPAFGCPTVNIGSRQDSRLRGGNVIDAGYDTLEIVDAIELSLSDKDFRDRCLTSENPYGQGDAGKKIAAKLSEVDISDNILKKKMTLLGEVKNEWFK
jgi:UDP-N-acetylglucosamine 2-epimerase (non-hydrolysing)/GDP/UDP-N,N'-diacetylbacillosamine 2-epimerase (hydrolysing)